MGLIFNSAATLDILNVLNTHYNPATFPNAHPNGEHRILRDFVNYPQTQQAAAQIGLVPSAHSPNRWYLWLDYLDGYPSGGPSLGAQIRKAMADAIDTNGQPNPYIFAIEFFAVPGPQFNLTLTNLYDSQRGQASLEITVETQLLDDIIDLYQLVRSP
jgi:hypothetical protein